jgi:hypothetical protein
MNVLNTRGAKMHLSRNKIVNACSAFIFTLGIVSASVSFAGPREQAKRMHDRLTGVPPTEAVLTSMTTMIENGDAVGAAMQAMQNPSFINTTIKDWATPWTNRDQSVYRDLNDSTATVMGFVRDDVPFDQILSADRVYIGSAAATDVAYATDNNDHYVDLQNRRRDFSDPAVLVSSTQSALSDQLGAGQTAGIMTTRGYAEAFLVAGTNRAALRFATLNFMCMDMENFRDKSAYPDRVRQDVDRSPGGDSKIFMNDCLTCHAGMDGLAGAFAYYDFDEETAQLVYTDGVVQPKYLRDAGVFRTGFETTNDIWVNYWRSGQNSWVGWNAPNGGVGTGAKELGVELAQTRQFSECQVKKAFEKVCYRSPNGAADVQAVTNIANSFEANNRSMKRVFAETAAYCMGN